MPIITDGITKDPSGGGGGGLAPGDLVTELETSASNVVLGRATAGAGAVEEIPCTAAGRALLDDADAAAQRATLGAAPIASPTFTGAPSTPSLTISGTAAAPAGSVRAIHPDGSTGVIAYNIPTGGAHEFKANAQQLFYLSQSLAQLSGIPLKFTGAPASAGASSRNIHSNGSSTDLWLNVPMGGAHKRTINGVEYESLNADGTVSLHATTAASYAAALGVGWTVVEKTTDETITSDSTLSDDATLKFSVSANTKYRFRFVVFFRSPDTPDFKFALSGPSSPTLLSARMSYAAAFGAVIHSRPFGQYSGLAASLTGSPSGTENEGGFVIIEGVLHNGANSGTVAFQWAQNTSDASNTTVLAGSYLEWKQV